MKLKKNTLRKTKPYAAFTKIAGFLLLTFMFLGIKAQTQVAVFQPGPSLGNDAFVKIIYGCPSGSVEADMANDNWGNEYQLKALSWTYHSGSCDTGDIRTFIRFDQLNTLPSNAIITSATLYLYGLSQMEVTGNYGNNYHPGTPAPYNNPNPIQIGRVLGNWNEQTITWNNQPAVDYSSMLTHPHSTQRFLENISMNVTSIVQNQVSSGINHGFGIRLETEQHYRSWLWASSDLADSTRHPKLIVEYIVPCDANFTYSFNTSSTPIFNFTANNQNGISYDWDFGDGTQDFGQSVQHIFTDPGTYEICLRVQEEERECEKCFTMCVTEEQTGNPKKRSYRIKNSTQETGETLKIENLYPNPAKEQITMDFFSEKAGMANLSIYDMSGKKINNHTYSVEEGNQQITTQISGLQAGMYFCIIQLNGQQMQQAFVIQ